MSTAVRQLFHELVDVPPAEQRRILAERRVPEPVRAEVSSLLSHDSPPTKPLTRRVSDAVAGALGLSGERSVHFCGPYRLVRLLGTGGMGTVYLGERHDGEIEQKVAIKLLRADADRPSWRERFLKERQLLAYLNHASIARLLDAGHTGDGRPYLVVEYVDGVMIDAYAANLDLHAKLKLFRLVCEGVSHAHRHLIVHRDLKPSNILVDSSGQPKLLDFGIAKLLDSTEQQTRTVERLFTPDYASPEQLRGEAQTTATDIYSLGAVLHRLLTGRPPREIRSASMSLRQEAPAERSTTTFNRLNPELPRDVAHILQKALRRDPAERYASVDAFADDIRAFLESKPVRARSGEVWYRVRTFLRRHRVGAVAAVIAATALLLGLKIADHQREVARTRLAQVRQLANKVMSLDAVAGGLHSSPTAMREVVAMSKEHLETFVAEARTNQAPSLEVAQAYLLLARSEGICMATGARQRALAEGNLRKASVLLEPILSADSSDRNAMFTAANISHDLMIVAENDRRNSEAVQEGRKAALYLDRFLYMGELSAAERAKVADLFYDMALSHKNLRHPGDAIRYARQSIELSRVLPEAHLRQSLALSMVADLLRLTGDLEGALAAIREARVNLESARFPNDLERRSAWCRVLGREGKILGAAGGISLNRPGEAIIVLQRAFDLLEEWTQAAPPDDAWSRLLFVSLGRELGDTVRLRDQRRALSVYDHALLRLGEVKDNPEARRGEAEILSASAYALRRLNRVDEAQSRIDTAIGLLRDTGDYPTGRITPYSAAYEVLLASGDHLFETNQIAHALSAYEDLFSKVAASNPDARNDLRHTLALSRIYGSLAVSYRSDGQNGRGREFSARRKELWTYWNGRLPGNGFVREQIQASRSY